MFIRSETQTIRFGPAQREMRDSLAGKQPAEHLQRGLDKFLAERGGWRFTVADCWMVIHQVYQKPLREFWTVRRKFESNSPTKAVLPSAGVLTQHPW